MGRFISWLASQPGTTLGTDPVAGLTTPQHLGRFVQDERQRGLKVTSLAKALGNIIGIAASLDPLRGWSDAWAVFERVRALVERVELHAPAEAGGPPRIELLGALSAMLRLGGAEGLPLAGRGKSPLAVANGPDVFFGSANVDAGTGFEPVTFRL